MKTKMKIDKSARLFSALSAAYVRPFRCATPFSPPSGLATGSFNGLHTKSKFLAITIRPHHLLPLAASFALAAPSVSAALIAVDSYVYGTNPESQPQPTRFQSGGLSDVNNDKLTDGEFATGGWNDGKNVGFRNDTDNGLPQPRITFNLGAVFNVTTVDIWTVSDFLGLDESVSISSSTDGVTFSSAVTVDPILWTAGFTNANLRQGSIDVSALPGGQFYQVDIFDKGQWMMINEVQFFGSPIPEPSSVLMLGLVSLGLLRRRRK